MASTFSINGRTRENLGSINLQILEVDITSYDATNHFDVSASNLDLPRDPDLVIPISDENEHSFSYDKGSQEVRVHDGASEVADTTDVGVFQMLVLLHGS